MKLCGREKEQGNHKEKNCEEEANKLTERQE